MVKSSAVCYCDAGKAWLRVRCKARTIKVKYILHNHKILYSSTTFISQISQSCFPSAYKFIYSWTTLVDWKYGSASKVAKECNEHWMYRKQVWCCIKVWLFKIHHLGNIRNSPSKLNTESNVTRGKKTKQKLWKEYIFHFLEEATETDLTHKQTNEKDHEIMLMAYKYTFYFLLNWCNAFSGFCTHISGLLCISPTNYNFQAIHGRKLLKILILSY